MNRRSVLVTAFDAFGSERINPSELAVQMLPSHIQEVQIHRLFCPRCLERVSKCSKKRSIH